VRGSKKKKRERRYSIEFREEVERRRFVRENGKKVREDGLGKEKRVGGEWGKEKKKKEEKGKRKKKGQKQQSTK